VSLLRWKPLKVDIDFKLNVLPNGMDSFGRLVFAKKIFLAPFEEPGHNVKKT
jgi:hypothetical protein